MKLQLDPPFFPNKKHQATPKQSPFPPKKIHTFPNMPRHRIDFHILPVQCWRPWDIHSPGDFFCGGFCWVASLCCFLKKVRKIGTTKEFKVLSKRDVVKCLRAKLGNRCEEIGEYKWSFILITHSINEWMHCIREVVIHEAEGRLDQSTLQLVLQLNIQIKETWDRCLLFQQVTKMPILRGSPFANLVSNFGVNWQAKNHVSWELIHDFWLLTPKMLATSQDYVSPQTAK